MALGRFHTDLTGKVFGKLTVKNFINVDNGGNAMWLCACSCGVERVIRASNLVDKHGGTKSCGCLNLVTQRRSKCKRGHEFTLENSIIGAKGRRTCRRCKEAGDVKHWVENKEVLKPYRREWHLNRIGWTAERFDRVLKDQEGKCAICPRLLTIGDVCNSMACADHEHVEPPVPRGLLCHSCNTAIGRLQDSPVLLRKAADYIEKYQGVNSMSSPPQGIFLAQERDIFGAPFEVGTYVNVRCLVTAFTPTPNGFGGSGDRVTCVVETPGNVGEAKGVTFQVSPVQCRKAGSTEQA